MKKLLAPIVILLSAEICLAQETSKPIQDNSFLLEEAYNQEQGVVQHISAFQRSEGGDWFYTFTQEWPVTSQRHQLSFTLPLQGLDSNRGLGDIGLNYRYQLLGDGDARIAVSPRASLLLPTGDEQENLGAGGAGLQLNLPASVVIHPKLVTHWNAGTTLTPQARNAAGVEDDATDFNLGGSFVWLAHADFNVMFETAWASVQSIESEGVTVRESTLFINPGARWAHNLTSGLQIVPGVAFPIGLGSSSGEHGVFLYLSFEHPFGQRSN